MRISEFIYIFDKAIKLKTIESERTNNQRGGHDILIVKHLDSVRTFINLLEETELFDEQLTTLKESRLYTSMVDSVEIENNVFENFKKAYFLLLSQVTLLYHTLLKCLDQSSENVVSVKLPPVKDLKDYINSCQKIEKIFSQLVLDPEIGGSVELVGVEPGSNWLLIGVGTSIALSLIGSAAWAAMVIIKKYREQQYIHSLVKNQNIQNDNLKDAADLYKKAMETALLDAEAQHVYNEHFQSANPERFERLKFCIKALSEELNKGVEVQPSLTLPEDVKNLFPNIKNSHLIESRIKMITDNAK